MYTSLLHFVLKSPFKDCTQEKLGNGMILEIYMVSRPENTKWEQTLTARQLF